MFVKSLLSALAITAIIATPALAGGRHGGGSSSSSWSSSNSSSNSSSQANNRNSVSNRINNRVQPGAIGLASLAVDACHGSRSFGGGFPGGSIGIGWTTGDDTCRAAYLSQILHAYGYRQQAAQLLVNEVPEIRKVFAQPKAAAAPVRGTRQCNKWRGDVVGGTCVY